MCRVGQGPRTEEARVEACYQLISDSLSSHCGGEEVNSKHRGDTPDHGPTLTDLPHTGSSVSESRLLLLTPTETDWSNADQPGWVVMVNTHNSSSQKRKAKTIQTFSAFFQMIHSQILKFNDCDFTSDTAIDLIDYKIDE